MGCIDWIGGRGCRLVQPQLYISLSPNLLPTPPSHSHPLWPHLTRGLANGPKTWTFLSSPSKYLTRNALARPVRNSPFPTWVSLTPFFFFFAQGVYRGGMPVSFRSCTNPKPGSQPCSPTLPWPTWNTTGPCPRFSKGACVWLVRKHSSSVIAPYSPRNLSSSRTTTSGRHGERLTPEGGILVAPSKVFSSLGRQSGLTGSTQLGFGPRIPPVCCLVSPLPHTKYACDSRQTHFPVDCRPSLLCAYSSPEWQIVDLATSLYGKTLVPLYENFGPDSIGG